MPATHDAIVTVATAARRMAVDEIAAAAGMTEQPTRWTYFYITNEATIGHLTSRTARLEAQGRPEYVGPIGYASEIAARAVTVRQMRSTEQAYRDEAEVDRY